MMYYIAPDRLYKIVQIFVKDCLHVWLFENWPSKQGSFQEFSFAFTEWERLTHCLSLAGPSFPSLHATFGHYYNFNNSGSCLHLVCLVVRQASASCLILRAHHFQSVVSICMYRHQSLPTHPSPVTDITSLLVLGLVQHKHRLALCESVAMAKHH